MGRDERDEQQIVTFRLPQSVLESVKRRGVDEDRPVAYVLRQLVQDGMVIYDAEQKKGKK